MYGSLVGMNNLQGTKGSGKAGPVQCCHVSGAALDVYVELMLSIVEFFSLFFFNYI